MLFLLLAARGLHCMTTLSCQSRIGSLVVDWMLHLVLPPLISCHEWKVLFTCYKYMTWDPTALLPLWRKLWYRFLSVDLGHVSATGEEHVSTRPLIQIQFCKLETKHGILTQLYTKIQLPFSGTANAPSRNDGWRIL